MSLIVKAVKENLQKYRTVTWCLQLLWCVMSYFTKLVLHYKVAISCFWRKNGENTDTCKAKWLLKLMHFRLFRKLFLLPKNVDWQIICRLYNYFEVLVYWQKVLQYHSPVNFFRNVCLKVSQEHFPNDWLNLVELWRQMTKWHDPCQVYWQNILWCGYQVQCTWNNAFKK